MRQWPAGRGVAQPQAPAALRKRGTSMQRRVFELQGAIQDAEEAPDPLEDRPQVLQTRQIPVLAVPRTGHAAQGAISPAGADRSLVVCGRFVNRRPSRELRFLAVPEPSQVLVERQDACVTFVGDRADKAVV